MIININNILRFTTLFFLLDINLILSRTLIKKYIRLFIISIFYEIDSRTTFFNILEKMTNM